MAELRMRPGEATARVQGSRPTPYRVRIALRPLSERGWWTVTRSFAARAGVAATLLSGEMPAEAEEMFRVARQPLFPESDSDFQSDCNCPDWANPCKHIAAVHYVIGEALDRDPFLLFLLRGRPRETLLQELRRLRSRGPPREAATPGPAASPAVHRRPRGLPSRPSVFWKPAMPASDLIIRIGPPRIPRAPLRRLGEPPFLRGDPEAIRTLEGLYDRIAARALALALGEAAGAASKESNREVEAPKSTRVEPVSARRLLQGPSPERPRLLGGPAG
ncbi:SWIM zinc finger domain-containing protein [mine drainage metagenome]|uniref:SWIM zinc finger domain-containing protein n=1 Tax=mine drainage metagenome TaxID=410659 RepID=T1AKH8_9ZZZZ